MVDDEIFFQEEEGIDPERVVKDEHLIVDELLCEICRGLLWKPQSCASCQHLFCNKCIRTWRQINPISCPFRCSPYEEKRAPPYIRSLLARLSIRCCNSSFGCTEILPYDSLEYHETLECKFPTKQCRVCRNRVLINEIDHHQKFCVSTTIECSMCNHHIDRASFNKHTIECLQERLNVLIEQIIPSPDPLEVPTNNPFAFPQQQGNENWFGRLNNRLQRFLSTMPKVNLIGFEAVIQARQQSKWTRVWTIVRLLSLNLSMIPQILLLLLVYGIGVIIGCLIFLSLYIQAQVQITMYRSFAFIILFSGLICFGLPLLLTWISDTLIIIFVIFSLILGSSIISELPTHYFQINFNQTMISVFFLIIVSLFKITLLTIRFYIWCIPSYISAGCLAWIIIFLTFHLRRFPLNLD